MEPDDPKKDEPPEELIQVQLLRVKAGPGHYLTRNLEPVLQQVERAYRHKQSNPEERIPDHPIRAYGYDLVGTWLSMAVEGGLQYVTINCRVRPMAYAFAEREDGGVNATACREIAHDLRFAIFKFSPLNLFFKRKHTPEDARDLLAYLLGHGHSEPVDPSGFAIRLRVSLHGRLGERPAFTYLLPLSEGS